MAQQERSSLQGKELTEFIQNFLQNQPVVPASVYRLQFNSQFNFNQAAEVLDYLHQLGIQAVYASPYFRAKPGSGHGYDVTDSNALNPEVGSINDFEKFCKMLSQYGMTQVLDVVANHMGIGEGQNPLWQDVLENGPSSVYARFFDIDWEPEKKELKNRVLLPILGDHYGRVLEKQEIRLAYSRGEFKIHYWQHQLPVAPRTYPAILEYGVEELKQSDPQSRGVAEFLSIITAFSNLPPRTETDPDRIFERNREKEIAKERLDSIVQTSERIRDFVKSRIEIFNGKKNDPRSFDLLDGLLNEQAYRVAFWRVASEEINYRRFFDINNLAAIRTEDDQVFRIYHQLIFRLLLEGKVHGLRIDHPDGLYDPPAYFRKLQKQFMMQSLMKKILEEKNIRGEDEEKWKGELGRVLDRKEFAQATPLYIVVEKILDRKEQLPEEWHVHGTVGYDFLNVLNGLFVERSSEKVFDEIYYDFIGTKIDFDQTAYEKKKFFALIHMSSEINSLAHRLNSISEKNRNYRDFTLNTIAVAIREVIACFPVYRTYITPQTQKVSERDEKYIHIAVEKAKRKTPALPHALYDFLEAILTLKLLPEMEPEEERGYRDFILRFQQLTGPIMAKGLEDTAFYIYNRLLSLNEVGGGPTHFGFSPGDFHRQNSEHLKRWPNTFLASSTHDTKRSEDVRMRINVLSELAEEWRTQLTKWAAVNEKHKTSIGESPEPDRNTEYFIYQTLLGAWPDEGVNDGNRAAFLERIWVCLQKSVREAKVKTNWVNPHTGYEEAVRQFVQKILGPAPENYFLDFFTSFQPKISECGFYNAMSALVLKMASPGVVDTYQGTELWQYALVDPDNRREIDYAKRKELLAGIQTECSSPENRPQAVREWLEQKKDGRIKLYLLWRCLQMRNQYRELFLTGDYVPVQVEGERKAHVVAFLRKKGSRWVLAAAGRYFASALDENNRVVLDRDFWKDTVLLIPKDYPAAKVRDVLTEREIEIQDSGDGRGIFVRGLLNLLGTALLTGDQDEA